MLSSFVVSQRTEARKQKAPAAAGRGLRDLIADWLNASVYPTPPPQGDAHASRAILELTHDPHRSVNARSVKGKAAAVQVHGTAGLGRRFSGEASKERPEQAARLSIRGRSVQHQVLVNRGVLRGESGNELLDLLGMLGGQVAPLTGIVHDIVELGLAAVTHHHLQVVLQRGDLVAPFRAIAPFPDERPPWGFGLTGPGGEHIAAGDPPGGLGRCAGDGQDRGEEIGHPENLAGDHPGGDFPRPASDGRDPNTPFPERPLLAP